MSDFLRIGLALFVLITLFPVNAFATHPYKDGDVIISMQGNKPCFSYPQDKEIRKRPYSFGLLSVLERSSGEDKGWVIQEKFNPEGLIEPNSLRTCIKYGVLPRGTETMEPLSPLLMNTHYHVHILVHSLPKGSVYERNFRSDFCLVRDEKGNTVVVNAEFDSSEREFKCMKPSEKPKGSIWERLFGK